MIDIELTLSITLKQKTELLDLFLELEHHMVTFINDQSLGNNQNLQLFLSSYYQYDVFPYHTVADSKFIILDIIQVLNQTPLQMMPALQLFEKLCVTLEIFIKKLIIDIVTYNILYQHLKIIQLMIQLYNI